MFNPSRYRRLPIALAAATWFAAVGAVAQPSDDSPPPIEGSAVPAPSDDEASGHGEHHAADVGVDEPRTVRVAESDQDLTDRALDAVMMPARAQQIRDGGVDALVVQDLITEMADNGEDADGMTAALEAVVDVIEGEDRSGEVSAFVRARLEEGVRGRALAEALENEFGMGAPPSSQPTEAHGGSGDRAPEPRGSGSGPEQEERGTDPVPDGSGVPSSAVPSQHAPEVHEGSAAADQ